MTNWLNSAKKNSMILGLKSEIASPSRAAVIASVSLPAASLSDMPPLERNA